MRLPRCYCRLRPCCSRCRRRRSEGTHLQARTTGELAELCAANPKDPQADAKINFCHGFAQGAISVEIRHSEGKKAFCFPTRRQPGRRQ